MNAQRQEFLIRCLNAADNLYGILSYGEFVTGIWPPEFGRILNGESASMLAQDAQLGSL